MKWGDGCFVKKMWKMEEGCFFCKKVDLSSTQGALCTVSVFFTLLFSYWGCVRPLPVDLTFHIPLQLSSATFHELLNTVVRRHVNLHALFKTACGPGAFGKYIMIDRLVCLLAGT